MSDPVQQQPTCPTCNDGWCPMCHNSGIGVTGDPSSACHQCPPDPCPTCNPEHGQQPSDVAESLDRSHRLVQHKIAIRDAANGRPSNPDRIDTWPTKPNAPSAAGTPASTTEPASVPVDASVPSPSNHAQSSTLAAHADGETHSSLVTKPSAQPRGTAVRSSTQGRQQTCTECGRSSAHSEIAPDGRCEWCHEFERRRQTHCKHGTYLHEDVCLTCPPTPGDRSDPRNRNKNTEHKPHNEQPNMSPVARDLRALLYFEAGQDNERAAIVAWLERSVSDDDSPLDMLTRLYITSIKNGEHHA